MGSTPTVSINMSIIVSQRASEEIIKEASRQGIDMPVVRLGIVSGGCSGYSYFLDIVDRINNNDRIFTSRGIKLICDPKSYLYTKGTEIDYEQSAIGGSFRFINPVATRSCGCGTSFQA